MNTHPPGTHIHTQNTELNSRASRQDASVRAKEEQLADAWRMIRELQAQLALPSANRDPDAVGRVKDQV